MLFGDIGKRKSSSNIRGASKKEGSSVNSTSSTESVVLQILSNEVEIRRSNIEDVTEEYGKFAFNSGNTNDPESYSKGMSQEIFETFQDVSARQTKRKKHH